MTGQYIIGDSMTVLRTLPDESAHCCVTSPPYWGLRDYGVAGQLGLEPTPEEYAARMVEVFSEVRRVLRADGTLWLNIGDSYAANRPYQVESTKGGPKHGTGQACGGKGAQVPDGLKPKDLVGIPWRLAFALQADGWWLRSDIIWHKPTAMPEAVTDRPTKAHEYVFLLAKSGRYYYDAKAIAEPVTGRAHARGTGINPKATHNDPGSKQNESFSAAVRGLVERRNARSVWTVPAEPYSGAHFATMPSALVSRCILAGCPAGGVVLDPFLGSGTVGMVAESLGRRWLGIELQPAYEPLIRERTAQAGLAFGTTP